MKIPTLLLALCLSAAASEEDKQALRDLRGIYETAIATRDLSLLKPHLAPDFTAVMITADEVTGFAGIEAYWKKVEEFLGKDGRYQVELAPDDTIFEGNLAIAKGGALERVTRGRGDSFNFTTLWTAIARKEEGTWKLVRIHAAIDPVENPIIASLQRIKMWVIGGASALIGGLIGFLARRKNRAAPALP